MLAGIYYGAQYGDNVSAITMKIPHASSIVACIDGYQMTLKGKTGLALFTAGVSSFIGGTVAIVVLAWLAPVLSEVALLFGPVGLLRADVVRLRLRELRDDRQRARRPGHVLCRRAARARSAPMSRPAGSASPWTSCPCPTGSSWSASRSAASASPRSPRTSTTRSSARPFNGKIKLIPTWPEFKRIIPSALRGSVVGSFLGILPGGGPVIAQFAAYAVDKKLSKYRDEIGQGAIEGVAGQAAADEAAARTSFIPLMSIGIPENAVMALMMAAFIIKGIQPGPNMITKHPDLFWGLVASMWVGNCFLLILNVPLVRYLAVGVQDPVQRRCSRRSCSSAASAPTASTTTSTTSTSTAAFGVFGYIFLRFKLDPAPLMLGFILGPMLEENFRRAMLLSRGSFAPFVTRPISAVLVGLISLFFAWQLISFFLEQKKQRAQRAAEAARPAEAAQPAAE